MLLNSPATQHDVHAVHLGLWAEPPHAALSTQHTRHTCMEPDLPQVHADSVRTQEGVIQGPEQLLVVIPICTG